MSGRRVDRYPVRFAASVDANSDPSSPERVVAEMPPDVFEISALYLRAGSNEGNSVGVRLGLSTGERLFPIVSGGDDDFVSVGTEWAYTPLTHPVSEDDEVVALFKNSTGSPVDVDVLAEVSLR